MPLAAVESAIRERLADSASRFVFPSSVAADHWLREAARMAPGSAVAADRFLSWDSFKEAAIPGGRAGLRPASRELRLVFCADLLSRNAEEPFLREILPPAHRASWKPFAPVLAANLPATVRLGEAGGRGRSGALADYRAVRERYAAFLARRGFYEPSWEARSFDSRGSSWTIFFPELVDDFGEFEAVLSSRPESELRILRDPPPRSGSLVEHGSLLSEIRWALEGIGEAIDSGRASPCEIAVTVPGFAGLKPYIEREAALLGLPADFRSGASLADYPAGRFFSRIARAVDSGFAFADLRDLLLSGGIPWREKDAVRQLVGFGLEYTVLCPWSDGGRPVDPWLATFRESGAGKEGAEALYRGLSAQLGEFRKARGFPRLKAAWQSLSHSLLDPAAFPEDQDRVFARCVAAMDGLARAQRDAGVEDAPWAFSLFIQSLEAQRYVPRSEPGGVRFYDYRVSAGIRPKIHYVLNASQQALEVRSGGCPFLREDLRAELSLEERDASEDFIRRYAESGDEVLFSCSYAGSGGAQMPHGYFLGGPREPAERLAGGSGARDGRPARSEEGFWRGEAPFPARISAVRRAGMEAAARTALAPPGADFRAGLHPAWGPPSLAGMKSLSVSAMEDYLACPFRWFVKRALGAWTEESGISSFDSRFLGTALHKALERLYQAVARSGPIRRARLPDYLALVPGAMEAAIRESARERGSFAAVVLGARREGIEAVMRAVLEADCAAFEGYAVFGVEMEIEGECGPIGKPVYGRVDRLMEGPDGTWIIDYKTGKLVMSSYGPSDEEGQRRDLQMPAYARLLEAKGKAVGGVLLYGVRDRAYKPVAADALPPALAGTKPRMSLAQLRGSGDLFAATARATVEAIGSGDFETAPPRDRPLVCPGCRLRAACREHYQAR